MNRRPHLKHAPATTDRWTAKLRSGREVVVRPIEASDESAEREFLLRLSPLARHRRFLEQFRISGVALVHRLTHTTPRARPPSLPRRTRAAANASWVPADSRSRLRAKTPNVPSPSVTTGNPMAWAS